MKKLVSFFGDKSDVFVKLNEEAKAYAKTKDIEFVWKRMSSESLMTRMPA